MVGDGWGEESFCHAVALIVSNHYVYNSMKIDSFYPSSHSSHSFMSSHPRSTLFNRLPRRYAAALRGGYILLVLLVCVTVLAGIPRAIEHASVISADIRQMFIARGLPENFDAYFWIGLDLLSLAVYTVMAVFLLARRGDDWMALYVGITLILTASVYSNGSYTDGVFFWINILLRSLGQTIHVIFFYLFPDGKFVPRWARWLFVPLFLYRFIVLTDYYINHTSIHALDIGILVLLTIIGMGYQVYRYRKLLTPLQRQQVKWTLVGLSFTIPIVSAYIFAVPIANFLGPESASNYFLLRTLRVGEQLGLFIFPITLVFSMARYRLWDIDIAINKSLVYAASSVLLAIPFLVVFWGMQALLRIFLGQTHAEIAVAVSGLVVGVLFNPARKQAQSLIDRHLYGLRFDLNELRRSQRPAQVTTPGLLTGRILGQYEVLDVIGHGGMGEVYKGYSDDQLAAIKVLPQKFTGQPDFRKRFAREAETITLLQHPNIVKMYAYGETEDGIPYMAMEYIEGQELNDLLKERGSLPLETALQLIGELAVALDYAHSKGFVHRDIKPSNIMVRSDPEGRLHPVLMDFGVAKIQDAHTRLTGTGAVGTIDYMAPEQIKEAGSVDNRADIYAMGLLLYEMLTGQRPFQGNPAQVMFAHLQQPPPDPRKANPTIPGQIADVILRALSKRPDDRYPTAQAMAHALT